MLILAALLLKALCSAHALETKEGLTQKARRRSAAAGPSLGGLGPASMLARSPYNRRHLSGCRHVVARPSLLREAAIVAAASDDPGAHENFRSRRFAVGLCDRGPFFATGS